MIIENNCNTVFINLHTERMYLTVSLFFSDRQTDRNLPMACVDRSSSFCFIPGRSVHFKDGDVFLACCQSGDKEDIGRLIQKGADINTANVDGLTALHQVGFALLLLPNRWICLSSTRGITCRQHKPSCASPCR